jgi:hypothetical protein
MKEGVTKSGNKWKEYGGRNEYGGHCYGIQFENPCTREDCNEVANTPGWCCYFGYGITNGQLGGTFVMLKIYND